MLQKWSFFYALFLNNSYIACVDSFGLLCSKFQFQQLMIKLPISLKKESFQVVLANFY